MNELFWPKATPVESFPSGHGLLRLPRGVANLKVQSVLAVYSGKVGTDGDFTHIIVDNHVYRVVKLKQEIKAK